MKKTTVIMQPTYLPWIGYFDLMDQCDTFVFLDSVQFEKRSWQQRNRIKTSGGELILTVPVLSKGKSEQKIAEVKIDPKSVFFEKHLESLRRAYGRAPFFEKYWSGFAKILGKKHENLAEMNIEIILWIAEDLGIKCKIVRSSEFNFTSKKVELLIQICKKVSAGRYLSPVGSKGYIDENNLFEKEGIELVYQKFQPPQYPQLFGDFIPFLSAIDLLMNCGPESLKIIRSGRIVSSENSSPHYAKS